MTDHRGSPGGFPVRLIGVLGGIASGKSEVAKIMVALGAERLDADAAGHAVLRRPEVIKQAVQRWGDKVLASDGSLDRRKLADIVFADPPGGPRDRAFLEAITHPAIRALLEKQAAAMADRGAAVAVLDAPLLFEAGWDRLCDTLVYVEAPRETRLARARLRGWSDDQFGAREAAQAPLDAKRRRAHYILDNSADPAALAAQVERIWPSLIE